MPLVQSFDPAARSRGHLAVIAALLCFLMIAGCAAPPPPAQIRDPYETTNRKIHEFNKAFDRNIVRPSAFGYGGAAPGPLRRGVQNFAGNLGLPADILNSLLQARPGPALENTTRLLVNTTAGLGGILDPATVIGIEGKPTGFGETLHVWGVGEGNYVELPFAGPSTSRDAVGTVMDIALDPLRFVLPPGEANASTGIQILAGLGRRYSYSDTIDSILYDSADSYVQLRLLYLQNRRFELGQTGETDDFVDPYEDPYGQ
jgi:phospholipid-binding lipoprotein MlaA